MNFQKILEPIKRRLFLMIGRCIVEAVNNIGDVGFYSGGGDSPQRMQLSGIVGEILTDVERFQEYGIETYPIPGDSAEAVLLCPDGRRDNGFIVLVTDNKYRPTDLSEGDTCFYGKNDRTTGEKHRIHFKSDGSVEIWAGATNKFVIAKDGNIDIVAPNVNIKGNLNVEGDVDFIGDFTQLGDYTLTGSATVTTEATIGGVPYTTHLHIDSIGGTGTPPQTAGAVPPIPFATHTHDYTWTDPAGAGTTDPPA